MTHSGKKYPKNADIREGLEDLGANDPQTNPTSGTFTPMTAEEIRRRTESLVENIGALRFSLARIEYLEGYMSLFRDMVADCRITVEAHSKDPNTDAAERLRLRALLRRVDKILKDTEGLA